MLNLFVFVLMLVARPTEQPTGYDSIVHRLLTDYSVVP